MVFLAPALLALALAVAIPLLLHLLHRHPGPRVVFPALRYLRRAEQEHATRIRLRQILLLALRVLAILLLTAAAARPFLEGAGREHSPTSVVMVLDNSLSTAAVVGERRVLDELKRGALASLDAMSSGDRVWLLRAGSPWEPAVSGDAAAVAEAVRRTEPSLASADLAAEIQRAASILALEPPARGREIHLLSDLQESALAGAGGATPSSGWSDGVGGDGEEGSRGATPVLVVYVPENRAPENRAIAAVEVGGGLPPRADQRSTVAARLAGATSDSVAVRLVLERSVRAAGWARPGSSVVLPFPARPAGPVAGYVEIDPDPLLADNRRYFATHVAAPAAVALPPAQPFLDEAVSVLENAGRVRRVPPSEARVVLASGGWSADAVRRGASAVVLPPTTPLELAATNQRLTAAGIAWRYGPPAGGEARLEAEPRGLGAELRAALGDVRLRQVYGLIGEGGSVVLRLRDGDPWAVSGEAPGGGRFLLLASPLTVEGGTIATSAAMVPFLDAVITGWAAGAATDTDLRPGALVTVAGDAVSGPEGIEAVHPGTLYRLLRPGIYRVLSGTDTVATYAVNAAAAESDLTRVPQGRLTGRLSERLPGAELAVADPGDWAGAIFRDRLGRDITRWLLLAALLLLVVESAVAATGPTRSRTAAFSDTSTGDHPVRRTA